LVWKRGNIYKQSDLERSVTGQRRVGGGGARSLTKISLAPHKRKSLSNIGKVKRCSKDGRRDEKKKKMGGGIVDDNKTRHGRPGA